MLCLWGNQRKKMDSLLHKLYYDKRSPAYLAGTSTLWRLARRNNPGVTLKDVREFLAKQRSYTLHRPLRRVFPRNKIIATGLDSHWQADLCDMRKLKHQNSHYQYILTVVDVLSKFGMAEPVKRKTPEEVSRAFQRIMERTGRQPHWLMTDRGNEFKGVFQRLLQERDIRFYFAPNPVVKAANVERFNRTLKGRIWRYFTANKTKRYVDILQDIINSLNHTISRPIGMRPVDVNRENEDLVWKRLYRDCFPRKLPKFRFRVGDQVRVARWRKIFDKGYTPNFTKEIYTIYERVARQYPVYKLRDKNGDDVSGVFYAQQLQLCTENNVSEK